MWYGNIVTGLPVEDGSCHGVYASHVLEHLAYHDGMRALRNTRRMLHPAGIFRVVTPDFSAMHSIEQAGLGELTHSPVAAVRDYFRTSKHRWMWDWKSLTTALVCAGFQNIRWCHFGDCEDPAFKAVEEASKFDHAVALEARA